LPFGEFDYLFVSSQTRPHKNHFNLLKAYKKLLRENYFNIKLIFTGQFSAEMQNFIAHEKLHLDVLSLSGLPPKVHAAFYACAKLSVVPTLFEGGFPFVFSEALSVGTPVVMSDIPVVREALPEEFRKEICFDPYDINDMVARIAWALENHDRLLKTETIAYNQMKNRTWGQVAEEYVLAFISTASQNANAKEQTLN
jgi:glycosyltransferase involved in cell wall biosynthesis